MTKKKFLTWDEHTTPYKIKKEQIDKIVHYFRPLYGCHLWYRNGKLHQDNDLPAYISEGGGQSWYQNGKLHRDNDLPAQIHANGDQFWWKHDKLHRDNDLPAVIYVSERNKQWYRNGKRHRDNDLPAIVYDNGKQYWYQHGVPVDHVAIVKRRSIVILILLYQRKVIRVPWDVIRCEIAKYL